MILYGNLSIFKLRNESRSQRITIKTSANCAAFLGLIRFRRL